MHARMLRWLVSLLRARVIVTASTPTCSIRKSAGWPSVRLQDGEEEHKVVVAAPPSSTIALLLVCIGRSPLHVARGTLE